MAQYAPINQQDVSSLSPTSPRPLPTQHENSLSSRTDFETPSTPQTSSATQTPSAAQTSSVTQVSSTTQTSSAKQNVSANQTSYYEFKEWLWEILAWALGTAIFATIIALLIVFNGRPVSQWHSGVQISTTVAVLAQGAQAALLVPTEACISQLKWTWFQARRSAADLERFDEASRGPWGSAKLIFRLSKVPRLAHIGALAVIFMLAFPPFFQQAVETRIRVVEDHTTIPLISRAVNYTAIDPSSSTPGGSATFYGSTSDFNTYLYGDPSGDLYLANTISSSMLSPLQTPSDVHAVCPTGQCTWPPYTTLALCTSISDVSQQLIWQQSNVSEKIGYITLPGMTAATEDNGQTMWLTTIFRTSDNGLTHYMGRSANSSHFYINNTDNTMADIYLAYIDPCLVEQKGEFLPQDDPFVAQKQAWRAYKASIRVCLQTLSTKFNGSTDTSIVSSYTNITWERQENNNSLPEWHASHPSAPGDVFTMPDRTAQFLGGQVAMTFNMSASIIPGGDAYMYGSIFGSSFLKDIYGLNPLACSNNTEDYGLQGFTKRLGYLATGLTNALRTANGSDNVHGTSLQTLQYIHVDFWFLALPCALFITISTFFLATILRTTKVPLWKSSQIAVLYVMSRPEMLGTKSEMGKKAKKTQLRLDSHPWQLEHES